jgi:Helix-turn-helix domain
LKVSQPRLSDLKRGHIDLFSLDTLLNMADLAGMSPTVQVKLSRRARMKHTSLDPRPIRRNTVFV